MAAEIGKEATPVMGLWLEIDLDSEPISGSFRVANEGPKHFVGWLGLTSVLETLRKRSLIHRNEAH